MDFIFANLPFEIKGYILSFLGDYIFRKGRINEMFIPRISRETILEIDDLISKIPPIRIAWKTEILWRTYIEFSRSSPIWRIIRQNYEYRREEDRDLRMITPAIICYYERRYHSSSHVYCTPIVNH